MSFTPSTNKKFDNIIASVLTNTKAYESYFNKFNHSALTFQFVTSNEHDLLSLLEIMLRTKLTPTYTYYKFIQDHYKTNTPRRNSQHRYMFISSNYTSAYFLNFTYCMKSTYLHGILRNYDPNRQKYRFFPQTNSFTIDEARPLIVPQEFIQPIEVTILEHIHIKKFNHKLYNLIQNTSHELSLETEKLKIIRKLELLWSLLQIQNIISMLAKFIVTSDTTQTNFPHGFSLMKSLRNII